MKILESQRQLTPSVIVKELDKYVIGQHDAKKAVAVALRNRFRSKFLESRDEVIPKNILMIGPTGVGKTEIARRLAKLVKAPFIRVEASAFTEVGFHGRDVDQIIKDLADIAYNQTKQQLRRRYEIKAKKLADEKILDILTGEDADSSIRNNFRSLLDKGELEDRHIEIDLDRENFLSLDQWLKSFNIKITTFQKSNKQRKKMSIRECRPMLMEIEAEKLMSNEQITQEAIRSVEQDGIVVIDEIDKIVENKNNHNQPEASGPGVQRDLLPIIEGTTILTKLGNIKTDKILFIASGAFHQHKPSDMLPELQGRLPIRVELTALQESDFYRILTEPEHNLLRQQTALMQIESIKLNFTEDGVKEISKITAQLNSSIENLGARRLHSVVEKVVEDINYNCDLYKNQEIIIDAKYVTERAGSMVKKLDMMKFVL